jgi:hypothetical protein
MAFDKSAINYVILLTTHGARRTTEMVYDFSAVSRAVSPSYVIGKEKKKKS